ncbi:MAG: TonB-dependent receptor [Calditrichaeota bacterium]|nr:TonB-dependent receptor [Calditrichota bacterium]
MILVRACLLLLIALSAYAQRPNFSLQGSVVDSISGSPLEYATFILHSANDSTVLTGCAASGDGSFKLDSLRPGRFFAKVSFLGYETKTVSEFTINRETPSRDIGKILLAPTALNADEVTVTGERMAVEYHVEKKVINVAKQQIAPNGTATDVLANSPGVSVDIEGNVKLRGSGNFTVMIDGRPSILDANDALQQVPAASIDRIEIITNPSARFSAEGTSGIINIIPLKRGAQQASGMINLRSSIDERRSGDITLVRPVGSTTLTLSGDLGIDHNPGESRSETRTTFQDVTSSLKTEGSSSRNRDRGGVRAELDIPLGTQNNLVLGGRVGSHVFGGTSNLVHVESDDLSATELRSFSQNESNRDFKYFSVFSGWKHRFPEEQHTLSADLSVSRRNGEEETHNESFAQDGMKTYGLRSSEDGPGGRAEFKVDYVRPLPSEQKLESGLSIQTGGFEDNYTQSEYDTLSDVYVRQQQFSNSSKFRRTLPAGYLMYSNEGAAFEYQLGLRGEYLDRSIERVDIGTSFDITRFDLYPSLHTSYDFGSGKQALASYSRRVQHSRPWELEPFESWEDAYSVRSGNPDLKPEFTDSYEMGYQTSFLKQFVSVEGFYRVKHNNVERVQSVYAENVTLTRPENVGRQFSLGTELRTDLTLRKGWTATLSGSLFDQRVKGETATRSFDEHDFTYEGKLSGIFALARFTKLQLDGQYRGPEVTSQGTTEADVMFNAALRQDFMERRLNVSLAVRDIFASGKREFTNEAPGLYSYNYFSMDAPVFTLSLGYSFNNFKKKRDNGGRGDVSGEEF